MSKLGYIDEEKNIDHKPPKHSDNCSFFKMHLDGQSYNMDEQTQKEKLNIQDIHQNRISRIVNLTTEKRMKNIKIRDRISTIRSLNKIIIGGLSIGLVGLWAGSLGSLRTGISPAGIRKGLVYAGGIIIAISWVLGIVVNQLKNHLLEKKQDK